MSGNHLLGRSQSRAKHSQSLACLKKLSEFLWTDDIVGEAARAVYGGEPRPAIAIASADVVLGSRMLMKAPYHVLGGAIAGIRLLAKRSWLEFRDKGQNIGLLGESRENGDIVVRRIKVRRNPERLAASKVLVLVRPAAAPPKIDWSRRPDRQPPNPEADEAWLSWLRTSISVIMDEPMPADEMRWFVNRVALPDLALLALASTAATVTWRKFGPEASMFPLASGTG
jgi:hypothetical protein